MFYKKLRDDEIAVSSLKNDKEKMIFARFLRLIGDVAEKRVFSKNVVQAYRAKVTWVPDSNNNGSENPADYSSPGSLIEVKIIDKTSLDKEISLRLRNGSGMNLYKGAYVWVLTTSHKTINEQNSFVAAWIS